MLFGPEPIRPARHSDGSLPTLSLWGYSYIQALAENRLVSSDEAQPVAGVGSPWLAEACGKRREGRILDDPSDPRNPHKVLLWSAG